MNIIQNATNIKDRKVVLSTLWIFVVFTYIYADLAPMIFDPAAPLGATGASDGVVLGFAVFMQSAISRILMYRANRLVNIVVAVFHAVIIFWSLIAGSPPAHYFFLRL